VLAVLALTATATKLTAASICASLNITDETPIPPPGLETETETGVVEVTAGEGGRGHAILVEEGSLGSMDIDTPGLDSDPATTAIPPANEEDDTSQASQSSRIDKKPSHDLSAADGVREGSEKKKVCGVLRVAPRRTNLHLRYII